MSVKEHYVHRITGMKVFKYSEILTSITGKEFYAEEIAHGERVLLENLFRIPVQVVENSQDWFKMSAVKISVTTYDGVDKYIGGKVWCYNETEKTIKIYRINHGFQTLVGVVYFDSKELAEDYAAHRAPKFSYDDIRKISLDWFKSTQEKYEFGNASCVNKSLRLQEFFKEYK